jgi:hypothetical protein
MYRGLSDLVSRIISLFEVQSQKNIQQAPNSAVRSRYGSSCVTYFSKGKRDLCAFVGSNSHTKLQEKGFYILL